MIGLIKGYGLNMRYSKIFFDQQASSIRSTEIAMKIGSLELN